MRRAALALICTLAACGGGGGGGGGGTVPAPVASATGTAQIQLVMPSLGTTSAHRRMPLYISNGTSSIAIKINGNAVPASHISYVCNPAVPSGSVCTVTFPAPAGSDAFDIALGDAGGNLLSEGTVTATIVAGQVTVLHVTFFGLPAYVHLKFDTASPPVGAPSDVHLSADAYDASSNLIIGDNYLQPVVVSVQDTSGHVTMSGTQLTSPLASIVVHYDGKLMAAPATFSVSSPASTNNASATFAGDPFHVFPTTYPVFSVAKGVDGNIWFTECAQYTGGGACRIGKITTTGQITETPDVAVPSSGTFERITSGPDGNMWFSEGRSPYVGRVDPNTMQITQLLVSNLAPNEAYNAIPIAAGSDGNIWLADTYRMFKITPAGVVTQYEPPKFSYPTSIETGPDGALWMGEAGYIGRMASDGTYTSYLIPTNTSGAMGSNSVFMPDGKMYFDYSSTVGGGGYLQSITTSGTISVVPVSGGYLSGPFSVGPDGNLWGDASVIGTQGYSGVGKLDTATGQITVYPYSAGISAASNEITTAAWGADNTLWSGSGNEIVRFTDDL